MDSTTEESANNTDGVSFQFTETTNAENVASIEDFLEYKINNTLLKYFSPVVVLIGIVGNIVSILVLRLTSMKHIHLSLYLSALAVFDIGVLVGLGLVWIQHVFSVDIRYLHEWMCKVYMYLAYTFTYLSAWMLVCVTVDRAILVFLPLRAKVFCTRKKAVVSICLVTFVISGINCHWFFTVGQQIVNYRGKGYTVECSFLQEFDLFHRFYWPWTNLIVSSLLPFTILIVGNFLIIFQSLRAARRRRNQLKVANSKKDDEAKSMTLMLVAISLLFICFTSPMQFYTLIKLSKLANTQILLPPTTLAEEVRQVLQHTIVNLLTFLNSALNFFFYYLSGMKFRNSLRDLVSSCRKRSRTVFASRTTSHSCFSRGKATHSEAEVGIGRKSVANNSFQASKRELDGVGTVSGHISPSCGTDGHKLNTTKL